MAEDFETTFNELAARARQAVAREIAANQRLQAALKDLNDARAAAAAARENLMEFTSRKAGLLDPRLAK